jgi:hypothetical protein
MTINDIANSVCQTTGDFDTASVTFAQNECREHYRTLYNSYNWKEARRNYGPITISGYNTGQTYYNPFPYFLPYQADQLLYVSMQQSAPQPTAAWLQLSCRERDWLERNDSNRSSVNLTLPYAYYNDGSYGWPNYYVPLSTNGILSDPGTGVAPGVLSFMATVPGVSQTVYIQGVNTSNLYVSETITFSTLSTGTFNQYARVDQLTLSTSVNTPVTISDSTGMVRSIPAMVDRVKFQKIMLWPTLIGSMNLAFMYKPKCDILESPGSDLMVSHLDKSLKCMVQASMLERQRQYGKAQLKIQEAAQMIEAAKNLERDQAETWMQATPEVYDNPYIAWDGYTNYNFWTVA